MQNFQTESEIAKRRLFLLLFTRELIYHSNEELFRLEEIIRKKPVQTPKSAPKIEKPKEEPKKPEDKMMKSILSSNPQVRKPGPGVVAVKPIQISPPRREIEGQEYKILKVPEPKLPPEFQHLRPVPRLREIDLGKLNSLINDPAVQVIECQGPGKQLMVSGQMGRKPSSVTLENEELEDVIDRFSKASRIPADTGLFKVVVGHLIFSAVISDIVPSRFIIRKMALPRPLMPQRNIPSIRMDYGNYLKR